MLGESLLRPIVFHLLRRCFRIEVTGLEHYRAAGDKVLIISNHVSFLDPILLGLFLPERPAFAINIFQAEKWYFGWLEKVATLYRLDPFKPMSMKKLIQDLRKGARVAIFPEGRISTSGGIMKIYDGTGMIAEKTGAALLPVRIDGAEYTKVSKMGRKLRRRWFPRIRITVLPPKRFAPGQEVTAQNIYDLMTDAAFAASRHRRPILSAMLDASALHGGGQPVLCDTARADLSYRALFTRAFILSGKLRFLLSSSRAAEIGVAIQNGRDWIASSARELNFWPPRNDDNGYVGVLLPTSAAAAVTFTALHMLGKIPCMLNFSSGEANILHACRIATVKTVLTSRAFIEKGKLETVIEAVSHEHKVIYLEDIKPGVTLADKLGGLWRGAFPRRYLHDALMRTTPDDAAVILYTSGSEGTPKGVALSHANLLANIAQACARLDLTPSDRLFNALPVFHSFGLTIGLILPLVKGIKTFLYPSPLHYRVIPDLMYDSDATVMLGTDTFYNGYARYAHPYDFCNVRLAVAGAEKLKESTRRLYSDKFRTPILEGYGVTEASPVLSVNTPLEHRDGTVGRLLPGIECRLEPVEGLAAGGRLLVRGPNIMLGYLKADRPGIIQTHEEWYDTGDIVSIDEDGFIAIQGRAKRFAKIGGEMVSLAAVEELASSLMPDIAHAAIATADPKRGEQVILLTESESLTRDMLIAHAREKKFPDIALPRQVLYLEQIPRLGSGKIDYAALSKPTGA